MTGKPPGTAQRAAGSVNARLPDCSDSAQARRGAANPSTPEGPRSSMPTVAYTYTPVMVVSVFAVTTAVCGTGVVYPATSPKETV